MRSPRAQGPHDDNNVVLVPVGACHYNAACARLAPLTANLAAVTKFPADFIIAFTAKHVTEFMAALYLQAQARAETSAPLLSWH